MWLISGWHEALEFDALTHSMTWDETARFYVFSLVRYQMLISSGIFKGGVASARGVASAEGVASAWRSG